MTSPLQPNAGHYNDRLADAGYERSDVDIVVITHCHPDHIANLTNGDELTFPNAEIVFGTDEFDYWRKGENIPRTARRRLRCSRKFVSRWPIRPAS